MNKYDKILAILMLETLEKLEISDQVFIYNNLNRKMKRLIFKKIEERFLGEKQK